MSKKVLFIHRSVGALLIHNGDVYNLLKPYKKNLSFSDYDHNYGTLTTPKGKKRLAYKFPGDNTNPADLAELFSQPKPETKDILSWIAGYNVVILKSCYPNSNIKSEYSLEQIKNDYIQIANYFKNTKQKLGILTSPPLRPLATKQSYANRARELADWLVETDFGKNIQVFDFFDLLAEESGKRNSNMLRREYRRKVAFYDSHPNALANLSIAPKFVEFVRSF